MSIDITQEQVIRLTEAARLAGSVERKSAHPHRNGAAVDIDRAEVTGRRAGQA